MIRNTGAVLLVIALVAAAVLVTSCKPKDQVVETSPPIAEPGGEPAAQPSDGEAVQVGILTNAIAPFWDPMAVGMERAMESPTETPDGSPIDLAPLWEAYEGERPPCEASWKGPQDKTLGEQRRLLEEFEAAGVDGISISPLESGPLTTVIDDLVDSGMLVLCMDSDATESKRLAYIGTNNFEAGKMAGEAAVKVFGDEGAQVVGFVGNKAAENAKERIDGFREVASQHNIELIDVREDDVDPSKARRNAEDAIQAFPEIDGFLGIWSYDAPAITQAVIAAGKQDQIKVISFDAEPQTLVHLEKGEIEATVVQKPYLFGYLSVQLIYAMKVLGVEAVQEVLPEDGVIDTGVQVVTPENIKEFRAYLDDLGVESS